MHWQHQVRNIFGKWSKSYLWFQHLSSLSFSSEIPSMDPSKFHVFICEACYKLLETDAIECQNALTTLDEISEIPMSCYRRSEGGITTHVLESFEFQNGRKQSWTSPGFQRMSDKIWDLYESHGSVKSHEAMTLSKSHVLIRDAGYSLLQTDVREY